MNESEYKDKRASLVLERIRLMELLESQEDFPDEQTLAEYEKNKRQIMDLDDSWKHHVKEPWL